MDTASSELSRTIALSHGSYRDNFVYLIDMNMSLGVQDGVY